MTTVLRWILKATKTLFWWKLSDPPVHKSDVNFGGNLGLINIIAVDPGHVNLIDAVRVHVTPDSVGLLQPATSTNPRKFKLQSVHKEVSVRSVEQTVAV